MLKDNVTVPFRSIEINRSLHVPVYYYLYYLLQH
jgi:hypothetical protein